MDYAKEANMSGILAELIFNATRIRPDIGARELREEMRVRERRFRVRQLRPGQDPYDP